MNSRRTLGRAALVLCTAAIAAPAAQAWGREPAEHGMGGRVAQQDTRQAAKAGFRDYGGGAGAAPHFVQPAEHGMGGRVAQQDARQAAKAGFRDYGAGGTGGGGRAVLPAEHGMGGRVTQQDTSRVVIDRRPIVLESGGFDWADAGLGAAGAAGLVLVGGGAVLLARRGRREQMATT